MYIDEEKRPDPLGPANIAAAVALHLLFFAVLWLGGQMAFRDSEVVIPIELTVVPFENLDGNEDEPPPTAPPEPASEPAPEPKPEPDPEPELPSPPEPEPEVVVQVPEEKPAPPEPPKPPGPPKKPDPPKPPELTPEQKRRKRLEEMRSSATAVKTKPPPLPAAPPSNGRTGPKTLSDAEIARLFAMGATVGSREQISDSEEAVSLGALKKAIDAKWAQMSPQVGRDGYVEINVTFDSSRRIATCSLARSSGDATSDAAALGVVRSLGVVHGVTTGFVRKYSGSPITIRYHVISSR